MTSDELTAAARRHGIRLLLQFGSTVTNTTHADSDLDLAVLLERRPASLDEYADLSVDLQALVPEQEVDVVVINGADPLLLKQILQCCRLLYGSPRALLELQMYAYKRYVDHGRFLAMEREYVARKAKALDVVGYTRTPPSRVES